ncbi:putative mRNA-decapping enzyme subunit 1 [Cryptosporidium felis]|nr:putative mRNA-decapping enzyme subunit 1 [Cryptosporidium felis]
MSSSSQKLKKKSLEEERKRLNLQLLKRHDESISEIVAHSSFVSVYLMDENSQKWIRGEVEGFLHIVKRDIEPIYQLIVLNQKNPENLVLGISSDWELSGETNYLFYKTPNKDCASRVSCLWFYEIEERRSIEAVLKQIISKLMVNKLNRDINSGTSVIIDSSEPGVLYNNDARKTILGFLNKKSEHNVQNNEINVEQMIRNSVVNNSKGYIDETKNKFENTEDKQIYANNDKDFEKMKGSENSLNIDPLKRLLHFQGILGKNKQDNIDVSNNSCNDAATQNKVTSEAITNVIMDVLSSKQVYEMINQRIELLLKSE